MIHLFICSLFVHLVMSLCCKYPAYIHLYYLQTHGMLRLTKLFYNKYLSILNSDSFTGSWSSKQVYVFITTNPTHLFYTWKHFYLLSALSAHLAPVWGNWSKPPITSNHQSHLSKQRLCNSTNKQYNKTVKLLWHFTPS